MGGEKREKKSGEDFPLSPIPHVCYRLYGFMFFCRFDILPGYVFIDPLTKILVVR